MCLTVNLGHSILNLDPRRHILDATSKTPHPRRHIQDATSKTPHPRRHIQDGTSKTAHPRRHIQDGTPKTPHPRRHTQDATSKTPHPRHWIQYRRSKTTHLWNHILDSTKMSKMSWKAGFVYLKGMYLVVLSDYGGIEFDLGERSLMGQWLGLW